MSAQQSRGHLGLGSNKIAWLLALKLRRVMVDLNRDPLEGLIEVINRATGGTRKPKALGQIYLDILSGRIRFAAIPSKHATQIKANIAQGATMVTDGHASYLGVAN